MAKRRLPPEERGGQKRWQQGNRIAWKFPNQTSEVYEYENEHQKLIYRYDEHGIFFQCKQCHIPHVLLWQDYNKYVEDIRQSGERAPYYKVLCVDGGPRLQLARPDEQVEGMNVYCVEHIELSHDL